MPGLPVVGKAHEERARARRSSGSSMDRHSIATRSPHWADEHGYRVPDFSAARAARLDGFRLAFDVQSRFWGGAVASLREAPGESVEGLALPMPGDARGLVDHKEGAISGLYTMIPGRADAARRRRHDRRGRLSRGAPCRIANCRRRAPSSRRWCAARAPRGSARRGSTGLSRLL